MGALEWAILATVGLLICAVALMGLALASWADDERGRGDE